MALGRRREQFQQELMVPTSALPRSPGHPFYVALNKLLAEAKFDAYVEGLCESLYREGGRPSIPPGVFFRMLFIGYFEGIDSQRGIAWRCSDSLSLRSFLGLKPTESAPDHSSLTIIRQRLPKGLIEQVFAFARAEIAALRVQRSTVSEPERRQQDVRGHQLHRASTVPQERSQRQERHRDDLAGQQQRQHDVRPRRGQRCRP